MSRPGWKHLVVPEEVHAFFRSFALSRNVPIYHGVMLAAVLLQKMVEKEKTETKAETE